MMMLALVYLIPIALALVGTAIVVHAMGMFTVQLP
jgi:hypothetical protein